MTFVQRLQALASDCRRMTQHQAHPTAALLDDAAKEIARLEDLVLHVDAKRAEWQSLAEAKEEQTVEERSAALAMRVLALASATSVSFESKERMESFFAIIGRPVIRNSQGPAVDGVRLLVSQTHLARPVGNAVYLDGGEGAAWATASPESAVFQARAINRAIDSAYQAGLTSKES